MQALFCDLPNLFFVLYLGQTIGKAMQGNPHIHPSADWCWPNLPFHFRPTVSWPIRLLPYLDVRASRWKTLAALALLVRRIRFLEFGPQHRPLANAL